jgi:hypothetical protein
MTNPVELWQGKIKPKRVEREIQKETGEPGQLNIIKIVNFFSKEVLNILEIQK